MAFSPKHCTRSECPYHLKTGGRFFSKGWFYVKRTKKTYSRFQCKHCKKTLSSRSFAPDHRHKKPDLNGRLWLLLCEGVSLNAASRILGMTENNTYRKFLWLAAQATSTLESLKFSAQEISFDEMESIEHTKCKPLSIALMVSESYHILGAQVSEMPAKGRLADFSRQKYGPRTDGREEAMNQLFKEVKDKLETEPKLMKSDAKPSYQKFVEKYFPGIEYEKHSRGEKNKHQERMHELKQKKRFDPLFALNQRCASLRANIKRLTRRSWCTTKKKENLQSHLNLYIAAQHTGLISVTNTEIN